MALAEYLKVANKDLSKLHRVNGEEIDIQTPEQIQTNWSKIREAVQNVIRFAQKPRYDKSDPELNQVLSDLSSLGIKGFDEKQVDGKRELMVKFDLKMNGEVTEGGAFLGPDFLSEEPSNSSKPKSRWNRLLFHRNAA